MLEDCNFFNMNTTNLGQEAGQFALLEPPKVSVFKGFKICRLKY
jgi:hypothetical protein